MLALIIFQALNHSCPVHRSDLTALIQEVEESSYQTKLAKVLERKNDAGMVVVRIQPGNEPSIVKISETTLQIVGKQSPAEAITCLSECGFLSEIKSRW
jgi:hypothetical protein